MTPNMAGKAGLEVEESLPLQLKGAFRLEAYQGEAVYCKKDGTMRVADRRGRPTRLHAKRAVIPEWASLAARGDHHAVLSPEGKAGCVWEIDNLIVTVGKELMLDRLFGLSSWAAVTQTGVGTSATAAAVGNTDLTGGVWKNFDATPIRTSLSVVALVTFGTSEANITWQEMAVRTVSPSNKILNRVAPIGPFTKSTAVSILLRYTLTQG